MGENSLGENSLYPKSKFRFHLTKLRKVEDEDGKERFVVVSSEIISGNGKKFRESLYGTETQIEVVTKKPERFKLNQIYMLATRDVVWLWGEEA